LTRPALIFDDGSGIFTVFGAPGREIRADTPAEIPAALAALEAARASGNYLAGYFSYEAGYALEPRLAPLGRKMRAGPLLWFGVFEAPVQTAWLANWQTGRAYAGPLTPEWDSGAYEARFAAVKDLIAAGDVYQANLTFRASFAFAGDPLALFAGLRSTAGARYGAYVNDGTRQILSLSPELFFETTPGGGIATKPMKGTAARDADPVADARARDELARSAKNRAENLMIVDLLRNDLGRIARVGSVAVEDLFAVESYPTVHQMVSTVRADLKPGIGIADVVQALFPCGSVTGAPKIRAMEVIAELEQSPRGVYCGAVGWFAPDGAARFNVAIRTLTITGGRGELGIGGGVVQDSDGASEYAEALLKARFYETARRPLQLIETLRWNGGFVRLDRHLARMENSAAFFAIPFDRDKALAALEAMATGGDLRVRLMLDETGAFTATAAPLGPAPERWTAAIAATVLQSTDALARHKINWREQYDVPPPKGIDELVFNNERGEVVEGARSNVFVPRDGVLLTPPLSSGCLDGVLRRELLEDGRAREAVLTPDDLGNGFYFGNSLRGLIPAIMTPLLPPGHR
jgi:para-aminobenzoate synthetase/4-amino-4-deoxychorismate lyase